MIRHLLLTLTVVVFLSGSSMAQNDPAKVDPASLPAECYLFTSFRGNGDGLHLAWSTDGINFSPLAGDRAFITPTIGGKLMRDPCILQGPDGTYHLVWTTGWWDKVIGHSSSKDLIHWSEQTAIPVMVNEPEAQNSWAPEITYDPDKQEFIIFWATTIPGRFKEGETTGDKGQGGVMLNHRIYCTTTKDFKTFTPTRLFFNPGFSVIDSTLIKVGNSVYMIFKDETLIPPKKHLRVAKADSFAGPFTIITEAFTPPGVWAEGPSVIKAGDEYICYFDMYRDGKYGAMKTRDFLTWTNITDQLKFNVRNVRHGTAFKVSREVMTGLLRLGDAPAASAR